MTRTRKALIVVFAAILMACVTLFTLSACSKKELTGIEVTTKPAKVEYIAGETFDPTGMVVTATYGGEKTAVVTDYTYDLTGALKTSDKNVTITYEENGISKNTKLPIKVTNEVVSLTLKTPPTKTHYAVGETMDLTGMVVTAKYQDGSENDIQASQLSTKTEPLTAADTTVQVSFGGKTVDQAIVFAKSVTIKTAPTKTVYMLGEKFNPAGMVLEVTYTDDYKADVAVVGSIAVYKTGILLATDSDLEIDFGGFKVSQHIEFAKGVFIEAEDGIINSSSGKAFFDATYTEDGGSIPNEEGNEKYIASGGAYVGDMKANDSVTFVFTSDTAGKGNIAFVLASQYLKEDSNWTPILMGDCQFNKIVEFYVNGVKYDIPDSAVLPGGGEEGGEGNALLWFNWQEVVFENINFIAGRNDIELKFIPHNYTDTSQSGFSGKFTANIDSLKVTSAECEVEPLELIFDDHGYTATSVDMVKETVNGKEMIYVVINGQFAEDAYSGYRPEELASKIYFDFQTNASGWGRNQLLNGRVCTIDGNNFTLKIPVNSLGAYTTNNGYIAHFGYKEGSSDIADLKITEAITGPSENVVLNADYKQFTLIPVPTDEDGNFFGCVALKVTSTASIDEYVATGVKLEKDDNNDVYFVVNGTVKWTEYTEEDIAAYLNAALGFDFQGNLAAGGNSRLLNGANDRTTTVTQTATGEGTFEMKVKVTAGGALVVGGKYSTHFGDYVTEGKNGSLENFDTLAVSAVDTENTIVIGHLTYQLVYEPQYSTRNENVAPDSADTRKEHYYGCVGLSIVTDQSLTFKGATVDLEVEDETVYFVITGTYTAENYTEEELIAALSAPYIDFQKNPYAAEGKWDGPWDTVKPGCAKIVLDNGTYKAYYDVTDVEAYQYTNHYNPASSTEAADFKPAEAFEKTVTVGAKTYKIVVDPTDTSGAVFWGCTGLIITVATEEAK